MKIKIKSLILYSILIICIALYLNSIYIWITHLNYDTSEYVLSDGGLLGILFNPFKVDASGHFNYDIGIKNMMYVPIFIVGNILTIICLYIFSEDKEITIGENK